MVAPNTPRLGFCPHVNLARCYLHRAHTALQGGNLIQAGCLLRESIRRQLFAECAWKNCLPDKAHDKTPPRVLLRALRDAGHCGECGWDWSLEIISIGNAAAHCRCVDRGALTSAIAWWHTAIDHDPCGEPTERVQHCKPVVKSVDADDCDDDDGSDWWKGVTV
jgi:hypothetical protein